MNLPYTHVREVVTEVRDQAFPGYHVLPYNRFDVEHSDHWWLSPTGEKIAFRYAKAMFTIDHRWVPAGCVFCGFNVEKGFVQDCGARSHEVMKADWFWHRFLDLANLPLARVRNNVPLNYWVSCSGVDPG